MYDDAALEGPAERVHSAKQCSGWLWPPRRYPRCNRRSGKHFYGIVELSHAGCLSSLSPFLNHCRPVCCKVLLALCFHFKCSTTFSLLHPRHHPRAMELAADSFDWAHDTFVAFNDTTLDAALEKWPAFTLLPSLPTHAPAEHCFDSAFRESSVPVEQLLNELPGPVEQMQALQDPSTGSWRQ